MKSDPSELGYDGSHNQCTNDYSIEKWQKPSEDNHIAKRILNIHATQCLHDIIPRFRDTGKKSRITRCKEY